MRQGPNANVYNIMLPLWLILFLPTWLWLLVVPANYLIDRLVLRWSLGDTPDKGSFCRRHTWKICLAGFASDFAGMLVMLGVFVVGALAGDGAAFAPLLEDPMEGVGFNPFANFAAFLVVALAVALAGGCIYLLDRLILGRAGLDAAQARKSALRLALITAPYLYFFPSMILYDSALFTL